MWNRLADAFRKTLRLYKFIDQRLTEARRTGTRTLLLSTGTTFVMNIRTIHNHRNDKVANKISNISKLISWNINGRMDRIIGTEDNDKVFLAILEGCDIFCLQETKGEIKIDNSRCFNKLRKDSRPGGLICIGIHQDIANHLNITGDK